MGTVFVTKFVRSRFSRMLHMACAAAVAACSLLVFASSNVADAAETCHKNAEPLSVLNKPYGPGSVSVCSNAYWWVPPFADRAATRMLGAPVTCAKAEGFATSNSKKANDGTASSATSMSGKCSGWTGRRMSSRKVEFFYSGGMTSRTVPGKPTVLEGTLTIKRLGKTPVVGVVTWKTGHPTHLLLDKDYILT